jgi:hypothetical protein
MWFQMLSGRAGEQLQCLWWRRLQCEEAVGTGKRKSYNQPLHSGYKKGGHMIECTLIYQAKDGIASDSLRFKKQLQMVPRVGDTLMWSNKEPTFKVTDVVHLVNQELDAHEIWVYYQSPSE